MLPITYIGEDYNLVSKIQWQIPKTNLQDYDGFERSKLKEGIYIFDEEDRIWSYDRIVDKFKEQEVDPHIIFLQNGPIESLGPIYAVSQDLFVKGYSPANLLNKQAIDHWINPLEQYSQGTGPLTDATHEFRRKTRER